MKTTKHCTFFAYHGLGNPCTRSFVLHAFLVNFLLLIFFVVIPVTCLMNEPILAKFI